MNPWIRLTSHQSEEMSQNTIPLVTIPSHPLPSDQGGIDELTCCAQ